MLLFTLRTGNPVFYSYVRAPSRFARDLQNRTPIPDSPQVRTLLAGIPRVLFRTDQFSFFHIVFIAPDLDNLRYPGILLVVIADS